MKVKSKKVVPMDEVPTRFYDPERDGVTFSLLTTFKRCRERARLFLNGWTSKSNGFGIIFGSLAHGVNQRIYDDVRTGQLTELPSEDYIRKVCRRVEELWKKENPRADSDSKQYLEYSMILLEAVMPVYFKYWKKDFQLIWERVETEFKIPFEVQLPTGRRVSTFMKGKIDGSFRRTEAGRPRLFETKTKSRMGETGESNLADILPHELQVNIYLMYLWWVDKRLPEGLLYNIIRRPGMRQKKNESIVKFAKRVAADVRLRPEYYFIRLEMFIEKKDLEKQELELRDLVSDFIMWWNGHAGHYKNSDECENKYGTCAMLPICSRGDYTGFFKRKTVFRELADEL